MKKTFLVVSLFMFAFKLNAKLVYTDPVQNAKYISINNNIIIGFDEKVVSTDLNSLITVSGTLSGNHTGEIILVENGKKIIFKPYKPFSFNESVEVKFNNLKTSKSSNNRLSYSFQTQNFNLFKNQTNNVNSEEEYSQYLNNGNIYSFNSLSAPQPVVTISNNPSPGRLLLCNLYRGVTSGYASHLMIVNNDGSIHVSQNVENAADFSRQPNGTLTYYTAGKYFSVDSLYNKVDSFYCGNGYTTDSHELRILSNGHALLMSYDRQIMDMSLIVPGGLQNATVIGLIIQEIDENKNVVFQWRSWDYINILDAVNVNFTGSVVDYIHGNAIEHDNDGNIMISSRHLNEITKINRSNGAIIWRLGGVNNQFTFVNDTIPFHYQHHIRRIENGNITLYDNGNFRTPLESRALEFNLDEVNKVATLVWSYKNTPVIYGGFLGSVQRLRNGNTLIGWGGTSPTLTEVTPSGTIALEMKFPTGVFSYRALRDEVNFTLNVKLAVEGMYNAQTDILEKTDTVIVYLRNADAPYNIVDFAKSAVDSVLMKGNFKFYDVSSGTFYISVKHRNGIETWSKAGGETFVSGGVYLYDFTASNSNSFGNNLKLKGSKYCIFSGDVNQDGVIDAGDISPVDNDVSLGTTGYVTTDVNGDNIVDVEDLSIVENNVVLSASAVTP